MATDAQAVTDEAQLIREAQAGSQDAYCELVERYKGRAMSIALGLLRHGEDAKDVSQEAFVTAYRALSAFRGESTFATWLYRIVVNKCHDALRARTRRKRWLWQPAPSGDDEGAVEDVIELVPDAGASARDAATAADEARQVQRAIARLSPRQQAVVTLRYLQGMSIEDVAGTLGCARGTVKAQLARALRHLRTQLNGLVEVRTP